MTKSIGVWFPTIKAGTGVDRFTESLVSALNERGIRAEISWLPRRAEYMPWTVPVPRCPDWATVIHINSWLDTRFLPKNIPRVVTIHSCVHDAAFSPYKSVLQRLYHRFWVLRQEKRAIGSSSYVNAVSKYTAEKSGQQFDKKIDVIPNWVDGTMFFPAPESSNREKFRLIFSGGLSRRKGMDLLPKIMKRLGTEFELIFTGDVEDFKDDVPTNFIPLGAIKCRNEMVKAYNSADALILPTRLEGLPLVVLEAMACGLPVVASNCSSLPEVVKDRVTGLLCQQDDIDSFVQNLRLLKANASLRASMSREARKVALNHYSPDVLVSKYVRAYQEILGRN